MLPATDIRRLRSLVRSSSQLPAAMIRLFSLLTLLVSIPSAAQPDIVGDWSGSIDVSEVQSGAGSLTVIFHVSDGDEGYAATLDSPDQGAFGLPLSDVAFDGETFSANLAAASASYSGIFDAEGSQIVGRWTQGANTMLLVLTPFEAPEESPAAEGPKPSSIKPGDYSGDWAGTMQLDSGGEVHLTFHLTRNDDDTYNAILNAPGQAENLDIGQIEVYGKEVVIDIIGQASFAGTVSDDETAMEGTLEQGGSKTPITLTRL